MAESRVGILIEQTRKGTAAKDTAADLKGLDQAAKQLSGGLSGLAGVAGGAGLVALGGAALSTTIEFGKAAAAALDMRAVFDDMAQSAGESGEQMLASMKRASAGMVSDAALVEAANRSMLLGVADSSAELVQLLDVARVRGQAMGLTLEEAFGRVTTGIGRQSALILDDLGIQVDATAVNEAYAASLGRTASSLSEAEKKQALYNHVLATTAPLIASSVSAGDDNMASFEKMAASAENAKIALGELALASGLPEFLDVVNQSIKDSISQIQDFAAAVEMLRTGRFADLGSMVMGTFAQDSQSKLFEAGEQLAAKAQELREAQANFAVEGDPEAQIGGLVELEDAITAIGEEYNRVAAGIDAPLIDIAQLKEGEVAFKGNADGAKEMDAAAGQLSRGAGVLSDHLRDGAVANSELNSILAQSPAVFAIFSAAAQAAGVDVSQLIGLMSQAEAQLNQLAGARAGVVSGLAGQIADLSERGLIDPDQGAGLFQEGVAKVDRQVQVLTEQLARGNITQDEFAFQMAFVGQTADDSADSIDEADRAAQRYASTLENDAAKAASKAAQAFEDLKGKVAGVLSDALSDTAGVNPDEILDGLGMHEDAIAENARRLADVAMNGFKDQDWLGEFASEVPDIFKALQESSDPKAAAAGMLKEFQAGLWPELLDKDLLKDAVRDMIISEQAKDALATEIAQELAAEMGTAVPEALAAARSALGAAGGEGGTVGAPVIDTAASEESAAAAGAAFGGALSSSIAEAGTKAIARLGETLKAEDNLKLIGAAGAANGKRWGDDFLATVTENVPQALIDLLVNLVTPGVGAKQKQAASMTGASG